MEIWDVIIIGAGSAGLAASIYTVRSGLRTLVFDEKLAGGNIGDAPKVENYPGFAEISGRELSEKMISQCQKFGVIMRELEMVEKLRLDGKIKTVITPDAVYQANAVLFTTGAHHKVLGVRGEKEFQGRGVSYCGICDGPFFKGKNIAVVGGGNSACITSLYLSGIAKQVTIIHRRDAFRAEHKLALDVALKNNVDVLWNTEVEEIKGDRQVRSVALRNGVTGEKTEVAVDAVFVQVGEVPNSAVAKAADVEVDAAGYIKVNMRQETNFLGVYAAGDVTTHPVKQVGTAVGQGITAALQIYSYIQGICKVT
ncbi:MAG: FAD-dependent oxidoreductase [Candidatus Bathyarchaeota archaeon]|nr:FAD-dependent oxidoreductase [Candidatus Termiticorpusculum sp.]MCL1970736.1 FAD-dependent oxidoreductase [Candidatus Termiticorpusculum sp.]